MAYHYRSPVNEYLKHPIYSKYCVFGSGAGFREQADNTRDFRCVFAPAPHPSLDLLISLWLLWKRLIKTQVQPQILTRYIIPSPWEITNVCHLSCKIKKAPLVVLRERGWTCACKSFPEAWDISLKPTFLCFCTEWIYPVKFSPQFAMESTRCPYIIWKCTCYKYTSPFFILSRLRLEGWIKLLFLKISNARKSYR